MERPLLTKAPDLTQVALALVGLEAPLVEAVAKVRSKAALASVDSRVILTSTIFSVLLQEGEGEGEARVSPPIKKRCLLVRTLMCKQTYLSWMQQKEQAKISSSRHLWNARHVLAAV